MPVYNQDVYRKEKHWKEGEFDVYRNMQWTGPGCHEGCGTLFYVKDGKLDHIEGDPNDEFNRGRLCMRCLNMVDEAVNNPAHSLRRTSVTYALMTGASVEETQKMARHADISVTMVYAQHVDRIRSGAEAKVGSYLDEVL